MGRARRRRSRSSARSPETISRRWACVCCEGAASSAATWNAASQSWSSTKRSRTSIFPARIPSVSALSSNRPPASLGQPRVPEWQTIVGIVADTPVRALAEPTHLPQLFMPMSMAGGGPTMGQSAIGPDAAVMSYVVRTATPPHALLAAVRRTIDDVDTSLAHRTSADAAGDPRRRGGADGVHDGAARDRRRRHRHARRDRHLWRDVVHRQPAHGRNRRPPRARRRSSQRCRHDRAPRRPGRPDGRRGWPRCGVRRQPADRVLVVRDQPARPGVFATTAILIGGVALAAVVLARPHRRTRWNRLQQAR